MNRIGGEPPSASTADFEAVLRSANPVTDRQAAGLVPESVDELVLREITSSSRPAGSRLRRWLAWLQLGPDVRGGSGWSWGSGMPVRLAFVGGLIVVAGVGALALVVASTNSADVSTDSATDDQSTVPTEPSPTSSSSSSPSSDQPPDSSPAPVDDPVDDSQPSPTSTPASSAPPSTSSPSSTAPPGSPGSTCRTVEFEELELVEGWRRDLDPTASGGAYLSWVGSSVGDQPDPATVMRFQLTLSEPGSYRLAWSVRSPATGDVAARVAIDGAQRFGPAGGGSYQGFVDLRPASPGRFDWSASVTESGVVSEPVVEIAGPTEIVVELAPGNSGHQLDRLLIHDQSTVLADVLSAGCP